MKMTGLAIAMLLILSVHSAVVVAQTSDETPAALEVISLTNADRLVELEVIDGNVGVSKADFSSDSNLIAYTSLQALIIWDREQQAVQRQLSVEAGSGVQFSPDNTHLAADINYDLVLWNLEEEAPVILTVLGKSQFAFDEFAFVKEGRDELVAVFGKSGYVRRWKAVTGAFIAEYEYGLSEAAGTLASHSMLSPDGSVHVILRYDGVLEWRSTIQGVVRNRLDLSQVLDIEETTILPVAVADDNSTLILNIGSRTSGQPPRIILLRPDGEVLFDITHEHGAIWEAAFSPNQQIIVLGNRDNGELYVWDAKTGEELATLTGHTEWITSLTFNAEGTLLMSTSTDGTVRVWGVPSKN